MILGWPLTFLWQGQIFSPILLYGENVAILEVVWDLQICNDCFTQVSKWWPLGLLFSSTIDSAKMSWTSVALLDARPTGDQEVPGSNLTKVGNILSFVEMIMK